jgi:hypothetical protein
VLTPVITPVDASIVATPASILLQLPPDVVLINVADAPTHALVAPVMATGIGLTVKLAVAIQPVGSMYLIIVTPAARAFTLPVVESIVATPSMLLVHTPPVVVLASVTVEPAHRPRLPVIAAGALLTVTVLLVEQPEGSK